MPNHLSPTEKPAAPVKLALRRAALARRQALPAAEVARRSGELRKQLFGAFPVAEWRWLHVFLPIVRRNEPDTWEIIRWIWGEKLPVRLAVPVVQPDGFLLCHYELTPDTLLIKNRWGIEEPGPDTPEVAPASLDAVLVPLLACDRTGHRVGYGGGFYDRFLAQCRPGTAFIGLNLLDDEPTISIEDVETTDIRLTALIAPGGVRWF